MEISQQHTNKFSLFYRTICSHNQKYWIGAEKKNKHWVWIEDGRKADIIGSNGIPHRISNHLKEDCMRLEYANYANHGEVWGLKDKSCSFTNYGFLCEGGMIINLI